jgi:FkbM family methyltransferase
VKKFLKRLIAQIANLTFRLRGLSLPDYFDDRDRITLLVRGIEHDVINASRMYLKPGMVVLDIGANVGLMARVFARSVGKQGKVIAFEPDPQTMIFLRHNIRSLSQVELSTTALSDENTVAKLHLNPRSGTSNSLIANQAAFDSVDVTCTTLDTFLTGRPLLKPDFIKIDVEGAELKVFAGMKETLARFPQLRIVVEFCPGNLSNANCSTREYYDVLAGYGLKTAILRNSGPPVAVRDHDDLIHQMGSESYVNLVCEQSR